MKMILILKLDVNLMVWKIKVMIDIYTNYNYNIIRVIIF